MTTKLALVLSLAACVDADVEEDLTDLEQASHSTSVASLPDQIVLARFDDTAASDVLQYSGNRLFVNRADYAGTPILHHYFPTTISQLIVGDFSVAGAREHGRDQVCAKLVDNTLYCYAPSDDRSELWYWFAQTYPLASGEQAIVGDFTGDGADDILAFNSSTGTLRLFDRTTTGLFAQKTFSLGNLASFDLRGKKLYAGEFGLVSTRADLIVVDPVANTVARFDSTTDSLGRTTFWWAFTTGSNTLAAGEQVTVANLEGGSKDGLLLRNPSTGTLRAMRVEYGSGYLVAIPSSTLSLGQLPVTANSGTFAAVRLVDHSAEPGGANRDDVLFFDRTDDRIIETSARYDGSRMTYWWGWTKATPTVPTWVSRASKMALVLCKTSDRPTIEPNAAEIEKRVIGAGTGSIRDWLLEVSYGSVDIKNADVFEWVQGTLPASGSNARVPKTDPPQPPGYMTTDYIADCMQAAGITSEQYGGRVLVVMNDDNVAFQGYINYGAATEYDNLLANNLSGTAHELMHAFGLGHAHDDSGTSCRGDYCDTTSIMGDYYATWFTNAAGYGIGPGLNAMNLDRLGVVPASRIVDLANPTTSQSRTITLAALERPEANGTLYVRVHSSGTKYFTIALRHQVGYDRNVTAGVQIHEMDPGLAPTADDAWRMYRTTLHVNPKASLQPGDYGVAGGFLVAVNSFDAAKKTASITLTHY